MNEENKPFKVYSNDIQIGMSVYDITIQLRQQTPDGAEVLGNVFLSPQHAKALVNILAQNVRQYEEYFGEIQLATEDTFKSLQEKGILKAGPQ